MSHERDDKLASQPPPEPPPDPERAAPMSPVALAALRALQE